MFLVDVLQHNLYTGGAHFANSIYDDSNTTRYAHVATKTLSEVESPLDRLKLPKLPKP